jgi:hypothetical protein
VITAGGYALWKNTHRRATEKDRAAGAEWVRLKLSETYKVPDGYRWVVGVYSGTPWIEDWRQDVVADMDAFDEAMETVDIAACCAAIACIHGIAYGAK